MASDAVRLLEIQLEVYKRSLHEKSQRIDELEARNIDLEAQVGHLQELNARQQTQSKDGPPPPTDLNSKRESDHVLERDIDSRPASKRRRVGPQEPVQRRSSNNSHLSSRPGGRNAIPDVPNANRASHGTSPPPVDQTPKHVPQQLESTHQSAATSVPRLPRRETLGSGSRAHKRVNSSTELAYPVEDPGSESDPSYEPEDQDDAFPTQASRRGKSPNPALAARLAAIESFAHGVVAEDLLSSTAERQTLGRRFNCKGSGTVVCRNDGRDFLFPPRKLHPYAPATQGAPGLFFSALLDTWTLSGEHEVFVGLAPAKYKYMGKYALQKMSPLDSGEFKSLPRGAKSHWGDEIMRLKKYGPIRKSIIQRGIYSSTLDAQDIIAAYEQGDEKLFVWRMKCIGFDYNLLRQATSVPSDQGLR